MAWGLDCEGIDGSHDAVALARLRNPKLRIRQHFLSEPFPFASETFQTVIMNQVIEHLEPTVAQRAVREIFRVLRPEGMALINSPSRFNRHERDNDPTHINMYSPKELQTLVREAGFEKVEALNRPLWLLGGSRLGKRLVSAAFRASRADWLSATANCRAFKPATSRGR